MPLKKSNVRVVSATEVISSGADGILPESALEGFAEYDSADPVDTFVNAIFLYDDKMVITFNYKDGTDTITFDDLKAALDKEKTGSDLDCSTAPKKEGHPYGCPSFLVQALLLRKSGRLRADDLTCKGNPTKVSLAHIPFLATYRSAHGQQNLWAVTKRQTSIRVPAFLTHRFCAAALTSGIFALFL